MTSGSTSMHYVQCVCILVLSMFTMSNACSDCLNLWRLVYEVEDNGTVVYGNLFDLIDAYDRGARFKYIIPGIGNEGVYVEEATTITNLGDMLCVQSVPQIVKNTWKHIDNDGLWRFVVACTNGFYQEYIYTVGENTTLGNNTYHNVSMKWLVLELSCNESIFAHDDDGSVITGSKQELQDAVVAGFDVRVTIPAYSYLTSEESVAIDVSSGEVVGQSVWAFMAWGPIVYWWFEMISSNGMDDYELWNAGEHTLDTHEMEALAANWYVDSCWRHAYTHDGNGIRLDGSFDSLIAAIHDGQRVKIVMGTFSIEVDSINIKEETVSAQILSQVGRNGPFELEDDNYWVWLMVHTSGTVRTRKFSIGEDVNRGNTVERRTISWFVDTRRWFNALSTDETGEVTSGSKEDLSFFVSNGPSVRVGLQLPGQDRWFYTKAANLELGPSNEVAATLPKIVGTKHIGSGEFKIRNHPYWRFAVVTTESKVNVAKWRVGTHENVGQFSTDIIVNWFLNF